ncbi:putative (E)-4-hydroxy-3-methylbut-2-enyl-diphosphate synthase (ferredoxin) [Helianthus debilis subsp. tardiflorus]
MDSTNHGSLSDHIMSYDGDSSREMVESAFESARICSISDYHNFEFFCESTMHVGFL